MGQEDPIVFSDDNFIFALIPTNPEIAGLRRTIKPPPKVPPYPV